MNYAIAVYGAPYTHEASESAYRFACAVLDAGHELHRVFFYLDGVHNGTRLSLPPQDEVNIPGRWSRFAEEHDVELILCVAASLRRGVIDRTEAERYERDSDNIADGFTISGLGQLIDAAIHADRLVTFAP